jgi:hypothetical protein
MALLGSSLEDMGFPTSMGITTPFYYIGKAGSMFVMHVEDHDLYSVSLNIEGSSKHW